MTIVLLQNHRRKGNVFYLQPLESGGLVIKNKELNDYVNLNFIYFLRNEVLIAKHR